ncbi:MAG: hypothetical protein LBD67_10900 [Candidatus Accumulibacter sp.]|jgi:hypothetical protein|nr:hypothetical protein [Accumulibacter sp.]
MSSETLLFSLPAGNDVLRGSFSGTGNSRGIVLLSEASAEPRETSRVFLTRFHDAGLSTFSVNLLTPREESFSGIHDNVPLLCGRLRDFLDHLKRYLARENAARQDFMFYAADAASPAALRVSAERDGRAIVCHGGLIDRAGTFYLNSLNSPLLFIADRNDAALLVMAERAFRKISGVKEMALIDPSDPGALRIAADRMTDWFLRNPPEVT